MEVTEFDYLGLCLDHELLMNKAVEFIIEKAESALNSIFATARSLRYDKHDYNPSLSCPPIKLLRMWQSNVLPQFTISPTSPLKIV